jgi:hypothetical protein
LLDKLHQPSEELLAVIGYRSSIPVYKEDFQPTRLPTFTPAPPVVQATFESISTPGGGGFPPILAIFGFLIVGIFGSVISFLRGG